MDPAADRLVAALDLQHQRTGIRKAEGFHFLLLKKLHHLIIGHLIPLIELGQPTDA